MPAKAGIQGALRFREEACRPWTPAFAGVTAKAGHTTPYPLPSRRISRITALKLALSEAITMFGSIPTPCSVRPSASWIST